MDSSYEAMLKEHLGVPQFSPLDDLGSDGFSVHDGAERKDTSAAVESTPLSCKGVILNLAFVTSTAI
jgi:hypothetical protein